LNHLKKNDLAKESNLFIFSDGPKNNEEHKDICKVRAYLKTIRGFKTININVSEANKGLAKSIISGVAEILKITDRVIVLEDDLLTTPNFLVFMNMALEKYQNEQKVFSVSGFSFNLNQDDTEPEETYFLTRGWSWGRATWKKNWEDIDWQIRDYSNFKKDKIFGNGTGIQEVPNFFSVSLLRRLQISRSFLQLDKSSNIFFNYNKITFSGYYLSSKNFISSRHFKLSVYNQKI